MKRLIAACAVAVGLFGFTTAAGAVDEHAPHGGDGSHPHHTHTGNGDCHDMGGPEFEPGERGRHQGANQSGPDHGMWHGTCEDHSDHP